MSRINVECRIYDCLQAEIGKLGRALARHTGEEEQCTSQHLFQRLSVALMKGNAALFNNRVPDFGAAAEDL